MKKLMIMLVFVGLAVPAMATLTWEFEGEVYFVENLDGLVSTGDTINGTIVVEIADGVQFSDPISIEWTAGNLTYTAEFSEWPTAMWDQNTGQHYIYAVNGDENMTMEEMFGYFAHNNFTTSLGQSSVATTLTELNVVPEPMTLALVGLGGLFLRKRK